MKVREQSEIIPTGIASLDAILGEGIKPGKFVLFSASPSSGKYVMPEPNLKSNEENKE